MGEQSCFPREMQAWDVIENACIRYETTCARPMLSPTGAKRILVERHEPVKCLA